MLASSVVVLLFCSSLALTTSGLEQLSAGQLSELATTACMRDLNTFLESQHELLAGSGAAAAAGHAEKSPSASLEVTKQEESIAQAIRSSLDLVGKQLALARLNPQHVSEQITLLASAECDTSDLLALIENLHKASASDSCDQVSIDFLMIVANYNLTRPGERSSPSSGVQLASGPGESAAAAAAAAASFKRVALLNEFARKRVDACWQAYVSSVSRALDRILGKMTTFVFGFVEAIAKQVNRLRELQEQKLAGTAGLLTIKEPEVPINDGQDGTSTSLDARQPEVLRTAIETLKQLKVDRAETKRTFATAVHELYLVYERKAAKKGLRQDSLETYFNSNFIKPCERLVERVQLIVGKGQIYKGHISETLGQALAGEKRANPRLDYELQMFRICKLANERASELTSILRDVRRHYEILLSKRADFLSFDMFS